jgi:hypothetical protein
MNDFELLKILQKEPQTKKTLLHKRASPTEIQKIVKRLYRMCKRSQVGRGFLLGSNHRSETIFYSLSKTYFIVLVDSIQGIKYYYCQDIEDMIFGTIKLVNCYELLRNKWQFCDDVRILRNKVVCYY